MIIMKFKLLSSLLIVFALVICKLGASLHIIVNYNKKKNTDPKSLFKILLEPSKWKTEKLEK